MCRSVFIISITLFLFSCNKDNPPKDNVESPEIESQQDEADADTTMTIEETFSSALIASVSGEYGDEDLQTYLEEQIYPLVSNSGKVSLDKVSSSIYLLSYEENGAMKNLMIKKFYNPAKDEFVFEKSETQSDSEKQFVK